MYRGSLEGAKPADGLGDAILLPHLFSLGCDGTLYASSPSSAIVLRLPVGTETFEVYAGMEGKKGDSDGARLGPATFAGPQGLEAWDDVGGRLWVADSPAHTLRLVLGPEVRTVAGKSGVKGSVDGRARFLGSDAKVAVPARAGAPRGTSAVTASNATSASRSALIPGVGGSSKRLSLPADYHAHGLFGEHDSQPLALLDSPQFVIRLRTRHALIIAEMACDRLRLLDLDSWQVSTLRLAGETLPHFNLWSVPFLAQHFDEREFLKVQSYSTGMRPFKIDLATGLVSHLDAHADEKEEDEFHSGYSSSSASSTSLTSEMGISWESHGSLADLMASSVPSSPREPRLNLLPVTSTDDFPMMASYTFGSFFVQLEAMGNTAYTKDYYMSQPFAFVPHSNSLLYCSGSGTYTIKTNFLSPHPPYPRSTPISPRSPRRAPLLRRLNLAPLIDSPDLTTDVSLEHVASGTKWELHSEVLLYHHGMKIDRLRNSIRNSKLPVRSIDTFLRYLYFESLPEDFGKEACISMSHFMHLASNTGINVARLSVDFSACSMALSDEERCEVLIESWRDDIWREKDYVIQDLVSGIDSMFMQQMLPSSGLSTDKLASLERLVLTPCDVPSISEGELVENPGLPSIPIFSVPTPSDPSSLLLYASDFIFVSKEARGQSYSIRASGIHMHPQWKWFRRLLKCNATVARNRVVVLPLNINVIKAILEPLHCSIRVSLTEEESIVLLESAKHFGLISEKHEPVAPYGPLISICREKVFPSPTEENRLVLLERCKRLRNFELAASILDDLLTSDTPILFRNLFHVLDTTLLQLMQARSRGYGAFWVEANTSKFRDGIQI